jgi:hypothetical protein
MLAPRKTLWSTPDAVIGRVAQMVGPLSATDKIVDLGCGDGKVLVRWAEIYSANLQNFPHDSNACENETTGDGIGSIPKSGCNADTDEVEYLQETMINAISPRKSTRPQHPTFIGIDVDPDRIRTAQAAWDNAVRVSRSLLFDIPCEFHVANAVLNDETWNHISTTILYVYLTPRGMKQLKRQILEKEGVLRKGGTNYPRTEDLNDPCMNDCSFSHGAQRRIIVSYMNPLPETMLLRKEYVSIPKQPDSAYPIYMYEW